MLSRDTRQKGIVLITTMLTVVLVVMLVSAVVFSNIGSLKQTSFFYSHEEALMAANSGMQYALTRLQDDITWRGNKTSSSSPVAGLEVSEDNGNVIGMLISSSGSRSFFRIKFNYEDGDGGFDGLKNSSTGKVPVITSPYVSVNNLYKSTSAKVYPASSDGILKSEEYTDEYGTLRTKSKAEGGYSLPKSTCCLIVEGFAGPAVRDLPLSQVASLQLKNGQWTGSGLLKGELSHRVVEAYAAINSNSLTDAAAAAAGNVEITSNKLTVAAANGAAAPTIRSLRDLDIHYNSALSFPSGQVYAGDGFKGVVQGAAGAAGDSVNVNYSNDSSKFAALKWNDVPNAEKIGGSVITPGTYVWTKRNGQNVLVHLNKSYSVDEYKTLSEEMLKSAPVFSGNGNIEVDPQNCTIKVKGNAYVNRDGETANFIVRNDGQEGAVRPIIAFVTNDDGKAPVLTSNYGDIYIQGATLGAGSVTCTGNISLQGPSILESDPGVGVSVYSQKDVNILPIESATQSVQRERPGQVVNPTGGQTVTTNQPAETEWGIKAQDVYDSRVQALQDEFVANMHRLQIQIAGLRSPSMASGINANIDDDTLRNIFSMYTAQKIQLELNRLNTGVYNQPSLLQFASSIGITDSCRQNALLLAAGFQGLTRGEFSVYNYNLDTKFITNILSDPNVISRIPKSTSQQTAEELTIDDAAQITDVQKFIPKDLASDNYRENKTTQLSSLMTRYGSLKYSDQDIAGVIYAWNNINVNIGNASTLNLTGAMVAYGQDPSKGKPFASGDTGKIKINASNIGLTADPNYMTSLMNTTADRNLKVTMYSVF